MVHSSILHPFVLPSIIGFIIFVLELILHWTKRSKTQTATRVDRSTLAFIWGIVLTSILAGIPFGWYSIPPELAFRLNHVEIVLCFVLLFTGLLLRCWAVYTLGTFFTVNVAVHHEHRLISAGPYALLRHPSYTGLLLELLALGISYQHVVSLGIVVIPTVIMLLVRIQMEERVLAQHLGQQYSTYQNQTYALIPYLY
jgi:protein-S-isoprenylcysteine O-methyltransferase Ste14